VIVLLKAKLEEWLRGAQCSKLSLLRLDLSVIRAGDLEDAQQKQHH
jgi:hypothetical protein